MRIKLVRKSGDHVQEMVDELCLNMELTMFEQILETFYIKQGVMLPAYIAIQLFEGWWLDYVVHN